MKKYIRDSKMRSELKGAAMTIEPVLSIGKNSITPELIDAVRENIVKNELIKINILKNCDDDPKAIAHTLAGRTQSEVVQVIGRKIVLYKPNPDFKKRKFEISKAEIKSGSRKPGNVGKRRNHNTEIAGAKNKASRSGMSLRFVEEDDEEFDNDVE
ncbi:putative RNA-binding protein, YhbY family [Oribacterium sp. WCC10]|nr:YhbY family RNA-binding protein [Oribacterium sp. WCC10]SFG08505.1 putative RNA-binding protein, YhbY family [Oribacterium sp. WCC10]